MSYEFYTNSERCMPVNVLLAGRQECTSKYGYGPATRSYYVIHYIVDGKGTFQNETQKFHVKEDECFIIRPGELTYYEADEDNPWCYMWFAFEDNYLVPDVLKNSPVLKKDGLGKFFNSLLDFKNAVNVNGFFAGKVIELFNLLSEENRKSSYVEQSIFLMETFISKTITISDIADKLNINRSYYSSIFKKEMNMSAQEYYLKLRLNQAENLIKNYDFTISQVADATGFESLSNFSRMYKKHKGVSPSMIDKKKAIL